MSILFQLNKPLSNLEMITAISSNLQVLKKKYYLLGTISPNKEFDEYIENKDLRKLIIGKYVWNKKEAPIFYHHYIQTEYSQILDDPSSPEGAKRFAEYIQMKSKKINMRFDTSLVFITDTKKMLELGSMDSNSIENELQQDLATAFLVSLPMIERAAITSKHNKQNILYEVLKTPKFYTFLDN